MDYIGKSPVPALFLVIGKIALFGSVLFPLVRYLGIDAMIVGNMAVVVVAAAYFGTNWISHRTLTPAYAHGSGKDNWYDYTIERDGKKIAELADRVGGAQRAIAALGLILRQQRSEPACFGNAVVEHCVLSDNEIAFRLRGPGSRGGAWVEIKDCAIYNSAVGARLENRIRDLKIEGLGFGNGVGRKYQEAGGGAGEGYINTDECDAPALETLLQKGFPSR